MKLMGKKTEIRKLVRTDIPLLVKWKNDPEIADMVRGAPINTTLEIETRRFLKGLEDHETVRMIIETKQCQPIGFIALGEIDKENRKAEIGMLIGEKTYWNQGYGMDCLITLLRYLFYEQDFNRVGLEVFEYNHRAKRVYEKIGFKVEGVQRQGLVRNNQYYDIILMGITKDDYILQFGENQRLK